MKSFTVRVELLAPFLEGDYDILHKTMESKGLKQYIISDDGTKYHLPMAEYNISGAYTRATILDLAKQAVSDTKKQARILVTESNGRTWSNLIIIKD